MIDVIIASKNPIKKYGQQICFQALRSIIDQTYQEFQIILCSYGNDIESNLFSNLSKKITILNTGKQTFVEALNYGIKQSTSKYIARQDLDDWSEPTRFQLQIQKLERSGLSLLGTSGFEFKNGKLKKFIKPYPVITHNEIIKAMQGCNPFIHGSVVFRREEVLNQVGLYNENYSKVQDFEYWCRIASKLKVGNLPERLYVWRNWMESVTIKEWPSSQDIRNQIYLDWVNYLQRNLIDD